jgi:hypothetical protein
VIALVVGGIWVATSVLVGLVFGAFCVAGRDKSRGVTIESSGQRRPVTMFKTDLPGVRGLWFLSYIMPWTILGFGVITSLNDPGADKFALTITMALCAAMSVPLWYGVSRRRAWGWYYAFAVLIFNAGAALIFNGTASGVGSLVVLLLWSIYLAKRRHMFHAKGHLALVEP